MRTVTPIPATTWQFEHRGTARTTVRTVSSEVFEQLVDDLLLEDGDTGLGHGGSQGLVP